jgi:hypothetical protein
VTLYDDALARLQAARTPAERRAARRAVRALVRRVWAAPNEAARLFARAERLRARAERLAERARWLHAQAEQRERLARQVLAEASALGVPASALAGGRGWRAMIDGDVA